jgi:hypothetical protein
MSGTLNLRKPRNKKKNCLLGINAIYTVERDSLVRTRRERRNCMSAIRDVRVGKSVMCASAVRNVGRWRATTLRKFHDIDS